MVDGYTLYKAHEEWLNSSEPETVEQLLLENRREKDGGD